MATAAEESTSSDIQRQSRSVSGFGSRAEAASTEESEWATLDRAWVNVTRTRPNAIAGASADAAGADEPASDFGNELTIRIENPGPSGASAQLPESTLVVDSAPRLNLKANLAVSVPSSEVHVPSSVADEDSYEHVTF